MHISPSTIFTVTLVALNSIAIIRAVTRRHGVEGTLAWILAIFAIPYLGAIFYLLTASPYIQRTTRRKRRVHFSFCDSRTRRGQPFVASETLADEFPQSSLLELVANITCVPPTAGNRVDLLVDDGRTFEDIEAAVENARRSIWAEYYIIRNDETGHRFLELLAKKARQGVEVRLLYDAIGSFWLDGKRLRAIREAGGRADVFLPINPLRPRWSVHLRNHRKLIVLDGELAFTGGMNVGDEHSGRKLRNPAMRFHDSHMALRGPAVADLAQIFAEDWLFATDETLSLPSPQRDAGTSVVAMVPSGPDQIHNANGLLYFSAIASARQRIWLTSPYFIPDQPTLRALISAALRGVDVRIVLPAPARQDVILVGRAARSYYADLLLAGVRIFEYQPAMMHAKTMVVDSSWSVIGSANVDFRSFWLNFEIGGVVIDRSVATQVERRFEENCEDSHEVTHAETEQYSFWQRLFDGTARLLSPLL